MSQPEASNDPRRSGFGTLGWIVVVLLVVYPLSTGPAVKLAEHDMVSDTTLEIVYAPLIWLTEHCPPVKDFFDWYLSDVWKWSIFK